MGNIKPINIKSRTYYFYNDMISIKDFDASLLKLEKNSYKNNGIYNIGHITIKNVRDYEDINSVNTLYLIIDEVDVFIEESNGNKCLTFASTNGNKKLLKMYIKLFEMILKIPLKNK